MEKLLFQRVHRMVKKFRTVTNQLGVNEQFPKEANDRRREKL